MVLRVPQGRRSVQAAPVPGGGLQPSVTPGAVGGGVGGELVQLGSILGEEAARIKQSVENAKLQEFDAALVQNEQRIVGDYRQQRLKNAQTAYKPALDEFDAAAVEGLKAFDDADTLERANQILRGRKNRVVGRMDEHARRENFAVKQASGKANIASIRDNLAEYMADPEISFDLQMAAWENDAKRRADIRAQMFEGAPPEVLEQLAKEDAVQTNAVILDEMVRTNDQVILERAKSFFSQVRSSFPKDRADRLNMQLNDKIDSAKASEQGTSQFGKYMEENGGLITTQNKIEWRRKIRDDGRFGDRQRRMIENEFDKRVQEEESLQSADLLDDLRDRGRLIRATDDPAELDRLVANAPDKNKDTVARLAANQAKALTRVEVERRRAFANSPTAKFIRAQARDLIDSGLRDEAILYPIIAGLGKDDRDNVIQYMVDGGQFGLLNPQAAIRKAYKTIRGQEPTPLKLGQMYDLLIQPGVFPPGRIEQKELELRVSQLFISGELTDDIPGTEEDERGETVNLLEAGSLRGTRFFQPDVSDDEVDFFVKQFEEQSGITVPDDEDERRRVAQNWKRTVVLGLPQHGTSFADRAARRQAGLLEAAGQSPTIQDHLLRVADDVVVDAMDPERGFVFEVGTSEFVGETAMLLALEEGAKNQVPPAWLQEWLNTTGRLLGFYQRLDQLPAANDKTAHIRTTGNLVLEAAQKGAR
jgi:hypothetical protein